MKFNVNEAIKNYRAVFKGTLCNHSIRKALSMSDLDFDNQKPFDTEINGTYSPFTYGEWDSINYSRVK